MQVLAVTLSQFHDKAGFRLIVSDPAETALSEEQFRLYSDLILPRQQLCGRILSIEFLDDFFLVVSPILSQNREWDRTYKREKYIYSVSILVNRSDYLDRTRQTLYRDIVSRFARFLRVIEETYHIIYENDKYLQYIGELLHKFRKDINERGQCDITHLCSHYSFINANRPMYPQPKCLIVNKASVLITMLNQEEIDRVQSQLGRNLLRYAYEGKYTFLKICKMHREKKQTQLASFYAKGAQKGLIFILDMLNLNNCYTLTQKIHDFLPQGNSFGKIQEISKVAAKQEKVDPQQLLSIYLQFNRVTPLHKIIELNRKILSKVDIQKFIRFGQISGFLLRIHQQIIYSQLPQPLLMPQQLKKLLQQRGIQVVSEQFLRQQLQKMSDIVKKDIINGSTVDEVMVNLDVDYERLLKLLNPQNRHILKINNSH